MKKHLYLIAGVRPNFMKIAPIIRALEEKSDLFSYEIIHTGQHYDHAMNEIFFEELGIPEPNYHLNCGGGSHSEQTAKIMMAFEKICTRKTPDCVLVVGDVNSTLACSLVAKKLHIPVAHVEAGLRSGDHSMPEEINRLVTDSISDWFFCTEPDGVNNLLLEGKDEKQVFHVGHVMVDNLLYQKEKLTGVMRNTLSSEKLKENFSKYGVITLHRPANVDDKDTLKSICVALNTIARKIPLIFPVHPRTKNYLDKYNITLDRNIYLTDPLSYMDFLNLWKDAILVLTDSGGIQEETTALDVPCLTLRNNTERPITLSEGTNTLVGTQSSTIIDAANEILLGKVKKGSRPDLWDGHSANRIVDCLSNIL